MLLGLENIINEDLINLTLNFTKNLVVSFLIFFVGRLIAKKIISTLRNSLKKKNLDNTLIIFFSNVIYGIAIAFLAIAALNQLGVQTTSLAAMLAAAGLAIGLAFQSSLSNIASGVMIILFKPFAIGHFIEASGVLGTVEEVGIFNTKLKTPDNKMIITPNSKIISDKIINYSVNEIRRIDLVFGCAYEDDLKKVRKTIEKVLEKEERVLKDPEPTIGVLELADNSVNFAVRPWVKKDDYFNTMLSLNEEMKIAFDKAGISIPYPQRDMNIKYQDQKNLKPKK